MSEHLQACHAARLAYEAAAAELAHLAGIVGLVARRLADPRSQGATLFAPPGDGPNQRPRAAMWPTASVLDAAWARRAATLAAWHAAYAAAPPQVRASLASPPAPP